MSDTMDEICEDENTDATSIINATLPLKDNIILVKSNVELKDNLETYNVQDDMEIQIEYNGELQISESNPLEESNNANGEDNCPQTCSNLPVAESVQDVWGNDSLMEGRKETLEEASPSNMQEENTQPIEEMEYQQSPETQEGQELSYSELENDDNAQFEEENLLRVNIPNDDDQDDIDKETKIAEYETQNQNLEPLPECRNKRSYVCGFCNLKTVNPREYLYHLKDVHGENIKIFECSLCIYASKTHQKLARHNHMVHKITISPEVVVDQKKKTKEKIFKPSSNKNTPKPVALIRSPRESKSPRRFEEYEFMDDADLDYEDAPPASSKTASRQIHYCDQCNFSTYSTKVLGKHVTKYHLKRRFYKCTKCNYATQVKTRYTKHMKYHQMPIIKCEWCDFRTPYRWNLDRHAKNHTEEAGEHRCHLCNFSAQIKQSLTVHIANHHLTPEQIKEKESKRTIGISDPEDCIADEEMELLRMERDEDPEALELPDTPMLSSNQSFTVSNIDVGNQDDMEVSLNGNEEAAGLDEPKKKKPKIKITLKKMKPPKDTFFQKLNERHNFDEDFIHPDDVVHRHGNVYIKTEKCSLCPFKAPFQHEIQRHKKKVHGIHALKSGENAKKMKKNKISERSEFSESSSDSVSENMKRKYSPISNSNEGNSELPKDVQDDADEAISFGKEEPFIQRNSKSETSHKEATPPKKKSSFFDKLQEKLSSSNVQNLVCQFCGHESKCLSESVRHQKLHLSAKNIYATPSLSTRCQFCRHRCKTTDDLINHLKSCPEARKNQISDNMITDCNDDLLDERPQRLRSQKEHIDTTISDDEQSNPELDSKHPMENKVFVWNNISNYDEVENAENDMEETSPDDRSLTPSESAFSIHDSDCIDEAHSENGKRRVVKKRVYKCPQCSFWSTTASRFHVHIVGHYNTKPYRCSECGYRSNWRWDITKHIKLKIPRDKNHRQAEIRLADETGEKNYEKYDKYLAEVKLDEAHASRTEGGMSSNRRGRLKRNPENDSTETDSAKSSPCPTPLAIPSVPTSTITPSTGPLTSKFPAPPKLMRAPNRQFASSPGPNPFGPINPGAQMMVEMSNSNNASEAEAAKKKYSMKPPPLVAMGTISQSQSSQQPQQQQPQQPTSPNLPLKEGSALSKSQRGTGTSGDAPNSSVSNYQIITPQGALHTSLETLQLLAAGSTNLAKLKRQQKETGEGKNPELDAAVANQMRLLLWLNCLAREAEKKEKEVGGGSSGDPPISSIMQLVLDHEGNPEWKCLACDFRDNEQETVVQHVRLAHSKKGPVSLVHAVHRCSVCGFAAGTKRHVQVHLETAHNGQGGIISRSEGQNVDPENGNEENRSFDCRLCSFTCKKRGELKNHLSHHTPRVDYVFKCMFCSYYVATKSELFSHLAVHGMEIPSSVKEAAGNGPSSAPIPTMVHSSEPDDPNARHFVCDLCPFETRSRAKLMHHRQFHRPRGLPFSCPHCSYNVTRRHLLAQHLRIHGVSPTEGLEIAEAQSAKSSVSKMFMDDPSLSRSKSPSPSLTITPISGKSSSRSEGSSSMIDPSCLPTLSDELTKNLHDIPLVWVSRNNQFFKMFKCRHCPHVNLRKSNIQEHERMHRTDGLMPGTGHMCHFCSYICINAGVLSAHLKVHAGSMGKCHAIVDQALPNEEQLHMLAGSAMKKAIAERMIKKGDEKLLYYCQNCPGRFFFEKEVQIHSRFHISNANFTHHCHNCNFGARDESQILAHAKVHTPEYQERTRTLMSMHPPAPSFPPVPGLSVPHDSSKPAYGISLPDNSAAGSSKTPPVNGFSRPWLTSPTPVNNTGSVSLPQPPPTSRFKCDQCPSTFSKLITLQYHQSLHSADNPFRCNRCTYAAKTQDGLQQHLSLHEQADLEKNSAESFISPSLSPSPIPSPLPMTASKKLEETLGSLSGTKMKKGLMGSIQDSLEHPPIKLKFIGLKGASSSGNSKKQFKYYIEEQVPLSGVELLKRKNQIEKEMPKDSFKPKKCEGPIPGNKVKLHKPEDRSGNPKLHYPLHIDKSSGRSREKRYKCSKCPSAFEKLDQFNVHLNLHGSNYKYKCRLCDYSVKFYANFMMHIKRHKYHEKMEAQRKGLPLPLDDQMKYEPMIGENSSVEDSREREEILGDKENQFDFDSYPDMTTAEKQHIILQHKKADAFKLKEEDKDRKIFYCQYCPYANMRRDAVDSHGLRHQENMGRGVYKCNFCDYTASQPNFIREHTKVHFRPFKFVTPEGFMRHDKMEVWSINPGEVEEDAVPKKFMVFGHDEGNFTPNIRREEDGSKLEESTETEISDFVDSQEESGILVDFRSGDVIEAPSDFIITLKPPKGKSASIVNCNGTISGKHKSTKYMRARKKAKLDSSVLISEYTNQSDEYVKSEVDGSDIENTKTELKCESNALSNQEDSAFNTSSNPVSPIDQVNGELNDENSNGSVHMDSGDCFQANETTSLKESCASFSAVSH